MILACGIQGYKEFPFQSSMQSLICHVSTLHLLFKLCTAFLHYGEEHSSELMR